LGGYHFWWKYYLDDQALEGYANGKDNINYLGPRYRSLEDEGLRNTNSITLSSELNAFDYENGNTQKLFKRIGGMDVGCSPGGLIALGMVCFNDPRSRKTAIIDNMKLEWKLFKAGPNESSINTFYSMFKGFTLIPDPDPKPETPVLVGSTFADGDVRIIAALVNPDGNDADKETVSLINTSNKSLDLVGWTIAGNNGNAYKLIDAKFGAGEIRTFRLPARDAQLTNKAAKITLRDTDQKIVNVVNYDKIDIKSGYTIVF